MSRADATRARCTVFLLALAGAQGVHFNESTLAWAEDVDAGAPPAAESKPSEPAKPTEPAKPDPGPSSDGTAPVDGAAAAPPTVSPPELITFVEAVYPKAALDASREGTVVLRLNLDTEGRVANAEILVGLGYGLDEAALAAARQFRFKPAARSGTPVPALIDYEYAFRLPGAPEATAPETPVATEPSPEPIEAPEETPIDVTAWGETDAERLRQSAEAVKVVETKLAQRESADLGEVLARTQGVGVRRAGGLGSTTRFSLNGLTDDQVRFFVDGVPLELAGYPFGIANMPVNFVDRIEIYSGVVPIRFGADALGGAVNLVTSNDLKGTHAGVSYGVGSFDTHRVTVGARHLDGRSGLFARATGFFDYSRNDYPIDVEVPDDRGRLSPARIYRFHDGYVAGGGNLEVGVLNRRWAKRLALRGFITDYHNEYQHNVVMTVPYGGVTYGETSGGVSLRYEQPLGHGVTTDMVGGYTHTQGDFLDVATCVYDWFGRCVRERRSPGETDTRPHDQLFWDDVGFGRLNFAWRPHRIGGLKASVAPTYLTRTADERRQSDPDARDPLNAERKLLTLVNGLESELDFFDDRLEHIAFVKEYLQVLNSEEPRPGGLFRRRDRETHRLGVGTNLRYRFTKWIQAKASYEWATRLPRPDEIFGDNAFVVANLELEPELSHNGNLELTFDTPVAKLGKFRGGATGFLRDAEQLIVLLGNDRVQSYQNVFSARSLGVECGVGWTSPHDYLALDANLTHQDFRNTSAEGTFGDFEGDLIPNRPYLFANGTARVLFREVAAPHDEVSLAWYSRYVHQYYRGWESAGLVEFKQVTPAQFTHTVDLGYFVRKGSTELSISIEVQNLTDERVFDFFGVQRPGRSFYVKTTAQF